MLDTIQTRNNIGVACMDIYFITSNKTKARIAERILKKYDIKVLQLEAKLPEIQSLSVEEVARQKAMQYANLEIPYMIGDDGLNINALNGFPGALLKFFTEDYILRLMKGEKNREAAITSAIAYKAQGKEIKIFKSEIKGKLAEKPKGSTEGKEIQLGIDKIFIPEGYTRRFAEFNDEEQRNFWQDYEKEIHYTRLASSL